jgi:hypothetical protein
MGMTAPRRRSRDYIMRLTERRAPDCQIPSWPREMRAFRHPQRIAVRELRAQQSRFVDFCHSPAKKAGRD